MSLNDNRYHVKSGLYTGLRFSYKRKQFVNSLFFIRNLFFKFINCINNLTDPSPTKQDYNCLAEGE